MSKMEKKPKPKNPLTQLTAQEFITALKGESIEEGKNESPFRKGPIVVIKDVFVQDKVIIKDSEIINEFHEFPYQIIIESGEFKNAFIIDGGVFKKGFRIWGGVFHRDLIINNGTFGEYFAIQNGEFKNHFTINRGLFQGGLFVMAGRFKEGLRLLGGEYEKIIISDDQLVAPRLFLKNLELSMIVDCPLTVENVCGIETLHVHNTRIMPNTLVSFRIIKVNRIKINDFENNGRLVFNMTSPSSLLDNRNNPKEFSLMNAFLGHTSFIVVPFSAFERITIDHCQLNQIETYNNDIPADTSRISTYNVQQLIKKRPFEHIHPQERLVLATHCQELGKVFNGLQIAMQRQGNKVMENQYYAAFQEARYWNLRYRKKNLTDWSLFISLYFHRTSSDYSQNWLRPIGWIIVLGLPLFYFYFLGSPKFVFAWPWQGDWSLFWVFLGKFAEFLWPTHKFDFMYKSSGGWQFLDIFARIIIGFLIYQTIAAFRRMGKR